MGRFNAKFETSEDLRRWTNKYIEKENAEESSREFQKKYKEDIEYEQVCKKRNLIAASPVYIGVPLSILLFMSFRLIEAIVLLCGSLLLGGIGLTVASKNNLKDSELYNLSGVSYERLKKESYNYEAGKVGLLVFFSTLFCSSKKNLKEISNPDSWKKMK